MFRSRRHLAAAASFWVLVVAAAAAISLIPGASAAAGTPIFSDAFESGNLSQWTKSSGMTVQRQVAYAGSWAARATSSGSPAYAYKNLSTPLSELYYDGRFQAISQSTANVSIVRFRTAANIPTFSIFRLSSGKLSYFNGLTNVTTTGPVVSTGSWHDLEVHLLINGASSLVEVWLDGTKVITKTAESLGTTPVGRIYIGDNTTGHTFDYAFDNVVLTAEDSQPPSTPTGLTVTGSTSSHISLGWSASTDTVSVVGYDVFLNGTRVGSTSAPAYTFSGLVCGASYTLGIDAYDAAGNTSTRASVTAPAAPCISAPPPDLVPPNDPAALAVTATSQSAISVSWSPSTDSVGISGYDLFQGSSKVGTTTTTAHTFSGLNCGTTYTLGVDAFDGAGNVSGHDTITASTSPCLSYLKTLDSLTAYPVGLSDESNNCTLARSGLGDTFTMLSASTRCTWTNSHFSHMGRHEVFDVSMRFDARPSAATDWENEINLRPSGAFGNADCADGGNHEVMLLRLWVDSGDEWKLDVRGGTSLNLSDQVVSTVDLGPIVVGQTLNLKFDIVSDYLHGAASVWKNGALVYANRDRPLGFHYDCDRATDLSNFDLRMQHGVYRGWTSAPLTFTSSGFRFLVSEP